MSTSTTALSSSIPILSFSISYAACIIKAATINEAIGSIIGGKPSFIRIRVTSTPNDTYTSLLVCIESEIKIMLSSSLPFLYSYVLTKIFKRTVKTKRSKLSNETFGIIGFEILATASVIVL